MIKEKISNYLLKNRCTLLCVGPMSLNCVDASIELANDHDIPLMLIASRRQIDSEKFNGGYVNNWTTSKFANHINKKDIKGNIILARDHGGPWQNDLEIQKKMTLSEAMKSAKESYKADIDAGFQVLHIDPSIDIQNKNPSKNEILDRLFELYKFCWNYAKEKGKDIIFEVGTEEQSGTTNTLEELDYNLKAITSFCKEENLPLPSFVVIQTGTRVMETRNVGSFDSPLRIVGEIPAEIQVPKMIEICKKHNVFMKEHNTDYLSDVALSWHPRLGIHSANVAPEFGVSETKAFLNILEKNNLKLFAEKFLEISFNSKKWKKWILSNSTTTERERSIISGHYIFSNPDFIEIKKIASRELKAKTGIELDDFLKSEIKKSILRYLLNFRVLRN
jgi:hypothetical protein